MQPFLLLKARTTGNHVSPLIGLEAPSCCTVVTELVGPEHIYSPHSSPSPALHHHHNQHHHIHGPMHSTPWYSPPQQALLILSATITLPAFPLQWVIRCLDLPITPLFPPFRIPCGSITAQNLGPRLKPVCLPDTGKDDCGFYSLTGITKIY